MHGHVRTKVCLEFFVMLTSVTRLVAIGLTLAIAACATTPPPWTSRRRRARPYDAKTQLESGPHVDLAKGGMRAGGPIPHPARSDPRLGGEDPHGEDDPHEHEDDRADRGRP